MRADNGFIGRLVGVMFIFAMGICRAEDLTNYEEPGISYGREYLAQHFSERIDPFSGNLSLQSVDLLIPGNAGFDLRVIRSYNSNAAGTTLSPFGRGWDMHFGRVAHRSDQTCSGATPQTMFVELPDGSRQTLHKSNGVASTSTADYLTTTFWKGQCATGGGINVFSPDGTKYEMTEADGGYWHSKRIIDRFGNTLTLAYANNVQTGRKVVTQATADDGRTVTFTYSGGKLTSVTGGGVTWGYTVTTATDGSGSYQLTRVTQPAGGYWEYSYNGNLGTQAGSYLLRQIKNPFGGLVNYTYGYVSFLSVIQGPQTTVVRQKTAGSDTWGYGYAPSCSAGGNDKTTVTLPDGIGQITYEHFGYCSVAAGTAWKIGLLNKKKSGNEQTETLSWTSQAISDERVVRPGYLLVDNQANRALLSQRIVTRDSLAHTSTFSNFDAHGNPRTIDEAGNESRTKSLTYFNNSSLWIVGLVGDETITGVGSIDRTRGSNLGELRSESRYGVTTSFGYHANGALWTRTNANGKVTTYTDYQLGTAKREVRPEGVTITRTVDPLGNIASQTDGEYNWIYDYDGIGRLTLVNYPTGEDAIIDWTSTTRTLKRGLLTETTSFDSWGQVSSVVRDGVKRTFDYDALGRTAFESLPGSTLGTTTSYDILGRVKTMSFPVGSRSYSYSSGSMTITDERTYATRYDFDRYGDPDDGYLTYIATPVGEASTRIHRNKIGVVNSVVQDGVSRTYDRDTRFFLKTTTEPESGTTTFGRDNVGNMTSRTSGGRTVIYTYDGLNRLKTVNGSGISTILGYNDRSKVTSVLNGAASRAYDYDANGNLKQDKLVIDGMTLAVDYGYDNLDGLASITYPMLTGTVTYAPDALGRPTKALPYLTYVGYRDSGNPNSIQYANRRILTLGENSRQLPTTISEASIALGLTYDYDNAGNVKSIADSHAASQNRSFDYDGINRVKTANGPWGAGTISYAGNGNISRQVLGAYAITYGYAGNRLWTISGDATRAYGYDGAGNVTSNGLATFDYDAQSQLKCVNCGAGNEVQYQYDGQGRRVTQDVGGRRTYFVHSPNGDLQFEYSPVGQQWTKHVYLAGKRVATHKAITETATSTALATLPATPVFGQTVTLTATVTGSLPTGTVSFKDGAVLIAGCEAVSVAGSSASCSTTLLAVGAHALTAIYAGDEFNLSSTSPALQVSVSKSATATRVSSTAPNPSALGQQFAVSVSVTATAPGNGLPSGTATVSGGGKSCVATVVGGAGICTIVLPTTGTYGISATYSGDAKFVGSSSPAAAHSVVCGSIGQPDSDCDGIPDAVEPTVNRNPQFKDNDVLASGRLLAMQLYRDFLGREGEPSSIETWASSIDSGSYSRAQAVESFFNSAEFQGVAAPVARLYFAFFNRYPDYEGFQFNSGLIRSGAVTLAGLADFFAASPEFLATYGALDNTQYVTLLYRNVLERTPDAEGLAGWVALMNAGTYTRGQVMLGFSESVEYRALMANEIFVSLMYIGMVRRAPDPAGFSGWVGYLDTGTSGLQLIDGFLYSTEYHDRFLP